MATYYHGTRSTINRFTIKGAGKHGSGFYFTASYSDARAFASQLAGRGDRGEEKVYSVTLRIKRPFDTMSVEHASEVAHALGFNFRVYKNAGGPKEHYHHLVRQMISLGLATTETANDMIARAGFDAVHCGFFEHMIVFHEDQIEITDVELT
jgi:hypothetical protein